MPIQRTNGCHPLELWAPIEVEVTDITVVSNAISDNTIVSGVQAKTISMIKRLTIK